MQHIVLVTLSSTAVERAIAQCTSRWAMARGHRLNTSIVLAAVHGLSGLFRAVSAVEPFTLSSPSHSVPVPNRPSRLRGRKATLNQTSRHFIFFLFFFFLICMVDIRFPSRPSLQPSYGKVTLLREREREDKIILYYTGIKI